MSSYLTGFSYVASLILLAASAGMMYLHTRSWRSLQEQTLPAEEFEYRYRQFRRRMQTSAMLGILGVALSAGDLMLSWANPLVMGIYWTVVLLCVLWMMLLAVSDIWATRFHYGRIRQRFRIEQAKLESEFRRLQRAEGDDADEGE